MNYDRTSKRVVAKAARCYEWGTVAGQFAAGLEYRVTLRAAVIAEYKVTGTSQHVAVVDGTASARFITQHLVAGLAWRF